ncbi:porin family protein [Hymenobacter rubidus]|uniref:porin family protein n=1 Tax=Hymenobacter rubidus TaxID=1441626 RepID=UPI00191D3E4D|nr:porin family protein [Hymenobacter rubidus]
MKKTLLILLLAVASSTAAFAQARPGGTLSSKDYTGGKSTDSGNTGFGVKGGYNFSRPYGGDLTNVSAYHNFHAGVYGQFGFNNFSSIQVELLYNRKGYNSDIATGTGTAVKITNQTTRLDYFELPILYVANVTDNVSFHVGPQVSLLTKVTQGDTDLALASNGFNSIDFGGVAGAELRVGPARVGARYDLSFGKVFDTSYKVSGSTITLPSVHNQVVQVYVGIGLRQ